MDVQRVLQAIGRGFAAAVIGGVVGAVLTRGLIRLVILVADGTPQFTWTGLAFIALFYVLFLTPGAIALALSRARWPLFVFGAGAIAIPIQATGIAQTDLEAAGPFNSGQWSVLLVLFVAMAAAYAVQAAVVYGVARSGRRDREGQPATAVVWPRGSDSLGGRRPVLGGALTGGAADRRGDRLELGDGLQRAVLAAGHPADRLLHQRAAEVVGAALEHRTSAGLAELDPGRLDVADPAVQQQPGDRVQGPVLPHGRPRPGDAGQVDGRVVVHERQQHELGEAAALVLQRRQRAQLRHPVGRRVDVAVHHRRRRRDPDAVRRADDLQPGRRRQLALRQHPADVVVEDLRRRARHRVEPGLLCRDQELLERQSGAGGAVDDLHRAERVQVDARLPALHLAGQVEVGGAGQVGVDAALHADLGGTGGPRLVDPVADLGHRQRVGVGVGAPLGERTEPAASVADIGEVDVPVHDVGDVVTVDVTTDGIGERRHGVEVCPVGAQQRQVLRVRQSRRIGLGLPERSPHLGIADRQSRGVAVTGGDG